MKIRSIVIFCIVIGEIASNSFATGKRKTRCCGKNIFQTIFRKLSRRSSRRAPAVKHANIVKLSEKVDHSLSNWLPETKPSSISVVNNIYFDPYESVFVDLSRLSGLMGSLDVSENEYAKWGQRVDLFEAKDSHPPPLSYVKEKRKRRRHKIKSNDFRRMTQSYLPNDSYRRAQELSQFPPRKLKYPYDCYTYSRQIYQPECDDSKYDVSLVNHEFAGYYNEEPFSPEKIRTFKIFVDLEKGNRVPGVSKIM